MRQSPKMGHISGHHNKTPDNRRSIHENEEATQQKQTEVLRKKVESLFAISRELQALLSTEPFTSTFQAIINIHDLSPPAGSSDSQVDEDTWLLHKILYTQLATNETQTESKQNYQELSREFLSHLAYGWQEKYSIERAMELIADFSQKISITADMAGRQFRLLIDIIISDVHNRFILTEKFRKNFEKFIGITNYHPSVTDSNVFMKIKNLLQKLYAAKQQCNLHDELAGLMNSLEKDETENLIGSIDFEKEIPKGLPEKVACAIHQFIAEKLIHILPENNISITDKENPNKSFHSLGSCMQILSAISFKISYLILSQPTEKARAAAIDFWIKIAQLLKKEYGNLEAMQVITLGVNHDSVSRLKRKGPVKKQKILNKLVTLTVPLNNHENLRTYITKNANTVLPINCYAKSKDQKSSELTHAWVNLAGMGRYNHDIIFMQYKFIENCVEASFGKKLYSTNLAAWAKPIIKKDETLTLGDEFLMDKSYKLEPPNIYISNINCDEDIARLIADLSYFSRGKEPLSVKEAHFKKVVKHDVEKNEEEYAEFTEYKAALLILNYLDTNYSAWPSKTKKEIIDLLDLTLSMRSSPDNTDTVEYAQKKEALLKKPALDVPSQDNVNSTELSQSREDNFPILPGIKMPFWQTTSSSKDSPDSASRTGYDPTTLSADSDNNVITSSAMGVLPASDPKLLSSPESDHNITRPRSSATYMPTP